MKYKISIAVLFFFSSIANIFAQQEWFKDIKLSGYVIGQYQYTSKTDATPKDNFSTRVMASYCLISHIEYKPNSMVHQAQVAVPAL